MYSAQGIRNLKQTKRLFGNPNVQEDSQYLVHTQAKSDNTLTQRPLGFIML